MVSRRSWINLCCLLALLLLTISASPVRVRAANSSDATPPGSTTTTEISRINAVIGTIGPSSITVQTKGNTKTFATDPHVIVLLLDGTLGTLDQVQPGEYAILYLRGAYGPAPTVTAIVLLGLPTSAPTPTASTTGAVTAVNGTITAASPTSITLQTSAGSTTYQVSTTVSVRINGQPAHMSQLAPPTTARVYLRAQAGGDPMVIGVLVGGESSTVSTATPGPVATYRVITGTITAVSSSGVTVTTGEGTHTYALGPTYSVKVNGQTTGLSELSLPATAHVYLRIAADTTLTVVGVVIGSESTAVASPTAQVSKPTYTTMTGTVSAISATSVTLTTSDGTHTFPLAANVSVRLADRQRGSITAITAGTQVEVYVRASADSSPTVVGIIVQHASA
jgi:hypothetical protein